MSLEAVRYLLHGHLTRSYAEPWCRACVYLRARPSSPLARARALCALLLLPASFFPLFSLPLSLCPPPPLLPPSPLPSLPPLLMLPPPPHQRKRHPSDPRSLG